jgi:hypothetical protein
MVGSKNVVVRLTTELPSVSGGDERYFTSEGNYRQGPHHVIQSETGIQMGNGVGDGGSRPDWQS